MSIYAENLNIEINNKVILSNLNFFCNTGEITAIIGENGAGKSTLMNCLAGSANFTGKLLLNDKPIQSFSIQELAKIRAVLPQSPNLNFPFSVRDVVGLAMSLCKLSTAQQNVITHDCLTLVDAVELINRDYLNLSGGEKQRVQLARVLAQLYAYPNSQNRFLLLDEPTSALDLKHQYLTLKMLRDICSHRLESKLGVLIILHDLNLASFYCDKILLLNEGKLIAHDKPEKILTAETMRNLFGIDVFVNTHRDSKDPYLIPRLK